MLALEAQHLGQTLAVLCRRGLCCSVHHASNGITDSCKDALESKSWVKIMLTADVSCANHVPDHLVDTFNDAIGLRVLRGNDLAEKYLILLG